MYNDHVENGKIQADEAVNTFRDDLAKVFGPVDDAALAGRLLFAGVQRDLPEKNAAGDGEELFRPQEYLCRN